MIEEMTGEEGEMTAGAEAEEIEEVEEVVETAEAEAGEEEIGEDN